MYPELSSEIFQKLILKVKIWPFLKKTKPSFHFNMPNLVERGLASNPKMEYQGFLCIFQKKSAMATYGLKEMGKCLWNKSVEIKR